MTIEKKIIIRCSIEELDIVEKFKKLFDDMDDDVYNELMKNEIVSQVFYDQILSLYDLMRDGESFV